MKKQDEESKFEEESLKFIAINNQNEGNKKLNTEETANTVLTKVQCIKNLIIIGITFLVMFSPYRSIIYLQSSLNTDASLGTLSLFAVHVGYTLSCLFVPHLLIPSIGYKWSLFASQITYSIYITANIYPKWWTLLPSKPYINKMKLFLS